MPAFPPLRTGLKLTAVARIRWNTTADYDMTASDTGGYHGGGPAEEVAALVSLALGVRCRSGGITRRWLRGDPDPLGTPSRQITVGPICLSRPGAALCSQASPPPASTS